MKNNDVEYFSKKMNEMADKFNAAVIGTHDCNCPGHKCYQVDVDAAKKANAFTMEVYNEFKKDGYTDKDWSDLEESSGAKKRMDAMGIPKN